MISRRLREDLHVWPAFADLMGGIALVVLVLGLREGARADTAEQARAEAERIARAERERADHLHDELVTLRQQYGVRKEIGDALQAELAKHGIDATSKLGNLEIDADMLFATGRYEVSSSLRPKAQAIGAALVPLVQGAAFGPKIAMLMVVGHTDQEGSADDNLTLSTRRAAHLVELWQSTYLMRREADPAERCVAAKIVAVGVGETRPVIADEEIDGLPSADCGNAPVEDRGCRRNRRIEIRVVPKDERAIEIAGCH